MYSREWPLQVCYGIVFSIAWPNLKHFTSYDLSPMGIFKGRDWVCPFILSMLRCTLLQIFQLISSKLYVSYIMCNNYFNCYIFKKIVFSLQNPALADSACYIIWYPTKKPFPFVKKYFLSVHIAVISMWISLFQDVGFVSTTLTI